MGRRWGTVALALTLWTGVAYPYSGDFALWASKDGDFLSQNFAGTQTGYDAAIAYVGNNGTIHLGPGSDGITIGTVPSGVLVIQKTVNGYVVHGTPFRWKTRTGTETARLDSSGVSVDGRVWADSLRGDTGLQVGGQKITKILTGTFEHDFALVTNGTTLDETEDEIIGVDTGSNWFVFAQPLNASMSPGLSLESVRVTGTNQVTLRVQNTCTASVDNPNITFSYVAIRQ